MYEREKTSANILFLCGPSFLLISNDEHTPHFLTVDDCILREEGTHTGPLRKNENKLIIRGGLILLDFRQVQYFLCIYEEGNITSAARKLNIVQPALSIQLAKLEDTVGQKLFERTPHGMTPTSAGRKLYASFRPIVRAYLEASNQAIPNNGVLQGEVRIGMILSVADGMLSDALLEFSRAHPHVSVTVVYNYSAILIDQLNEGKIEAAILNMSHSDPSLSATHIIDDDMRLATSSDVEQDLRDTIEFSETQKFNLVLPTRTSGIRIILDGFAKQYGVEIKPVHECDSINTLLNLVENSGYATLLPSITMSDRIRRGARIRCHKVTSPTLVRKIVCATNPRKQLSPACAAFLPFLIRGIHELKNVIGD